MPYAAAGGAVLGGIAGAMSSGDLGPMSQLGVNAQQYSTDALNGYASLAAAGPGIGDYTKGIQSQRDLASTYGNLASSASGMYNFGAGNQLANQAFAGQREALQQSFAQQLQQANNAASRAGRSSNDPILRARLAQAQTQQSAQLAANQSSAAVGFARQSVADQLSGLGQQTQLLAGLGNQALSNQSNLFNMSQGALQNERNYGLQVAQNERAAGGGLKGAITGALGGASAGLQAAQGFGGGSKNPMGGGGGMDAAGGTTGMSADYLSGGAGYGGPSGPSSFGNSLAAAPRAQRGFSYQDQGYGGNLTPDWGTAVYSEKPNYGGRPGENRWVEQYGPAF